MSLPWGDYRTQIQRSVLQDSSQQRWTNEMLLDFVGWALDAFCAHTAVATATSFVGDDETKAFTLPGNVYEKVDIAGLVYTAFEDRVEYLAPVYYSPGMNTTSESGFYTHPDGTLNTVIPPEESWILNVHYFAYYNHPFADDDEITLPSWGYTPVAYLVGIHALTAVGIKEARISQYDSKRDLGAPDDSALRSQQEWMVKMYDAELVRHRRQDRQNTFRKR